ncbi:MAG: translation initiation factor IF-2 [Candidatus Woesearchaeota archaeon]|nr:translation initiation factor IF-2 [Candidatus Woesearchaeota archaeon]
MPEETKETKEMGKDGECHIRSPICVFEGHVDHGKSSLLDAIRGSSIVQSEPGRITQSIGAYMVPIDKIKAMCGRLISLGKVEFSVPGLLFIDTPGHAAFSSLRKRGGSLADFAVVVVDINEGFMPQTIEAVEILKANKTPFIIAANKIDLIPGWASNSEMLLKNILNQNPEVQRILDERIYQFVEQLYKLGFESERFDRVENFTKQISIVPVSATTHEGIPEMLSLVIGLAQRYLSESLKCSSFGFAKGSILEVKEEPGIGNMLDVIIYDGMLSKNDTIVIAGLEKPIVSKVRGLSEQVIPHRKDKRYALVPVEKVFAAAAVRIMASDTEGVISGMPLMSCSEKNLEETKEAVQSEVSEVVIEMECQGIIVKAESLGSLEAMISILKSKGISIRRATVGAISKKDITEAQSSIESNPLNAVILSFNVPLDPEAKEIIKDSQVKILSSEIIYSLIDNFEEWRKGREHEIQEKAMSSVVRPCKIQIMPQFIFRKNNPAVVGVDVILGMIHVGTPLMKEGKSITRIKAIQAEKESIHSAEKGKQVAVSLEKVTVGRQINGGDFLYSVLTENEFRKLKEMKQFLKSDEIDAMREIMMIMRKENPLWGV